MFHAEKIMFHVEKCFAGCFFARVKRLNKIHTIENGGLGMKKLLVLIMASVMTLSLAACGGNSADSAPAPAAPAQTEAASQENDQAGEVEFTEEQRALAQDFMSMAEEFDAVADKVNASPELLEDEELVTAMNELADEIINASEFFASPETLTPEAMGALRVAVDVGRSFIAETSAALDELDQ